MKTVYVCQSSDKINLDLVNASYDFESLMSRKVQMQCLFEHVSLCLPGSGLSRSFSSRAYFVRQ